MLPRLLVFPARTVGFRLVKSGFDTFAASGLVSQLVEHFAFRPGEISGDVHP